MLQRQPNSPEIYFSSGLIYRILGLPNQAENYWRYTLRLDPLNWEAIEQLTTYFNSHQRQDESIALIQETISASTTSDAMARIQANPHDWAKYLLLYHSLGDLYMLKNKFYDAATTFTILIAMALSTNDTVINDLGLSADITDSLEVPTSEADKTKTFLQDLILKITSALQRSLYHNAPDNLSIDSSSLFFSISPQLALSCRYNVFPPNGLFPAKANTKEWAKYLSAPLTTGTTTGSAKPNVSPLDNVVSNALLNLAKIFQDGISSGISARIIYIAGVVPSHFDLLALYMLSLSLNPSPSTANNIGILLASLSPNLSNIVPAKAKALTASAATTTSTAGIAGGKNPRELAVQYYNYGLTLDPANPHIFSNYGSLLRDLGRPKEAILMYQKAVDCQPQFNIALTNLASALRDQGQVDQAISYYRRAVNCSPNFVEAVSGLANSQASVCDWTGRGGYGWEKVSVDANGMLVEGQIEGWISKIAGIVDKQISDARLWGIGVIESELKKQAVGDTAEPSLMDSFEKAIGGYDDQTRAYWTKTWEQWMGRKDEGVMIVQLIEVVIRMCQRRWYLDRLKGREHADPEAYCRPRIPNGLHIPLATTILPFHAFTLPFNAMQISQISQRTSVRISMSALLQSWLPTHVFAPPPPPAPIADHDGGHLVVGYVSSDFLDHPLAHLMQSVFGMHDRTRFTVICYATTPSDNSSYRTKIEAESHVFRDVSDWTSEAIIKQIQADGVHILVNLNGFTRGSRNDLFAVRPCPVQISLIGFAGSLGGGWCDYLLGDVRTIGTLAEVGERDWVYKENILYMPRSFFVCDHRQSAPDSCAQRERSAALALTMGTQHYASFDEIEAALFDGSFPAPSARATTPLLNHVLMTPGLTIPWSIEQQLRVELRRETFPHLPPDAFLMANLNQLYKIDPTTFRMWLNILQRAPRAYLWLLQFPKTGEAHLMATARKWTNNDESVVSRILFTPIAEKSRHILRARACDLFIDTPECNAHTTAADVAWSGTPIVTLQRHVHKMCSRVSASVIECALTMPPPDAADGDTMEDVQAMVAELIPRSEEEYADRVVHYATTEVGRARLERIRRRIYDNRERDGGFFDTRAWVRCVETGFRQAWADWLRGETRDIYIE